MATKPSNRRSCGESGIRTHEELSPLPLFESGAFNRSAISPRERRLKSI
jgi:hypothetical protein